MNNLYWCVVVQHNVTPYLCIVQCVSVILWIMDDVLFTQKCGVIWKPRIHYQLGTAGICPWVLKAALFMFVHIQKQEVQLTNSMFLKYRLQNNNIYLPCILPYKWQQLFYWLQLMLSSVVTKSKWNADAYYTFTPLRFFFTWIHTLLTLMNTAGFLYVLLLL